MRSAGATLVGRTTDCWREGEQQLGCEDSRKGEAGESMIWKQRDTVSFRVWRTNIIEIPIQHIYYMDTTEKNISINMNCSRMSEREEPLRAQ